MSETGVKLSGLVEDGAVDRPSMTTSRPSASRMRAVPPPKMPTIIGSTTVSVNSAATVASIALPPDAIISAAAADASGWFVTAMPREAVTGVFSHSKTVPALFLHVIDDYLCKHSPSQGYRIPSIAIARPDVT